jgi:ketosteroid isomerase-like protein
VPNDEIVRRFYAAFTDRDLPALLDTVHPDIEFLPMLGVLYREHEYHGHAGIERWFGELHEQWERFEAHVAGTAESGDALIAFIHLVAHQGDQHLDAHIGAECHVRDGRIVRFVGRDAWDVAAELGLPGPPG